MSVFELSLNKDRYVALLEKLIGETEFLQDSPPKFIPQEDRYIIECSSEIHSKFPVLVILNLNR